MNVPDKLKYTKDHEWIKLDGDIAIVGITDFAQKELGEIVFVEVDSLDEELEQEEVFGTIEAVKTVSDLFMRISGLVLEVNTMLEDNPELINTDPYEEGWIVKLTNVDSNEIETLLSAEDYKNLVS